MPVQTEVQETIPQHEAHEPLEQSGSRPIDPVETNDHQPPKIAVWLVVVLMWLLFAFTFVLIWLRTKP